jgi:hypothetical protein
MEFVHWTGILKNYRAVVVLVLMRLVAIACAWRTWRAFWRVLALKCAPKLWVTIGFSHVRQILARICFYVIKAFLPCFTVIIVLSPYFYVIKAR